MREKPVYLRSSYPPRGILGQSNNKREPYFMHFSEILHQMAVYGHQVSLLEMVEQFALFAEQYKGLNFADFLKILAHYCQVESNKDLQVEINVTWQTVGDLLTSAAESLNGLYKRENDVATLELQTIKLISETFRRMILFQMICLWTRALEEDQCKFADILAALAEYAESEALKSPRASRAWRVAASMIRAAQEKAANGVEEGQELP